MTGMKSGAGDDPFADADTDDEPTDDSAADESEVEVEEVRSDRASPEPTVEPERSQSAGRMSVDELPYIARRNVRGESVKKGRDKNVLFELRPEIAEREDEFVAELERRLGTDVPKTDAREAALAAIWERPELVVPVLEEWGLGYFED